jgi:endonuclease/exonuclease/phosphatase family metal-dependent hydrolase
MSMLITTWNVQWCRGVDGMVDPARIAAGLRRLGEPHVACLQEVASGYGELPGSRGEDQPAALERELAQWQAVVGWAVDVPGAGRSRKRFGNMVLSRLPVGRVLRHALPWPAAPDVPAMPRAAVEAIVGAPFGHVRVVSTHLEYYSDRHRAAQVARLAQLHDEWRAQRRLVSEDGPFRSEPAPASTILCGDFNLPPGDALYRQILDIGFVDAWQALHPGVPHPPTFRVHERDEGESPYCCDFVFVTPELAPRLASIRIDGDNRASDHQPVTVEFS